VRILFDEQLPRRLARSLTGHDVRTAQQQGWAGVTNGELLRQAVDAGFDVLITADRNLQFQQSLAQFPIAIVVLVTRRIKIADLLPLVPGVLRALESIRPGELVRVG
jgi:predicted nuclease of predicted toxin-antitoxin system